LPKRNGAKYSNKQLYKKYIGTQVRIYIGRAPDLGTEHMLAINSFHCVMENYLHSRPGVFIDVFVHKQTREIVYTQVVEREWARIITITTGKPRKSEQTKCTSVIAHTQR